MPPFLRNLADTADILVKLLGLLVALVGIALALPVTSGQVKILYGRLYGITGAVYYETGGKQNLTKDGQLFLIKDGPRGFDNVQRGDTLQAASEVRFRNLRWSDAGFVPGPEIFLLDKGQCVIVLERLDETSRATDPASGGWVRVATSACRLFN